MKSLVKCGVLVAALMIAVAPAQATVTVTPDPGLGWIGYMNVSNLPANGGAYQFGGPWAPADLSAVFTGPVLKLTPNSIADPNEYWYLPSGGPGAAGQKIMEANMYVENSTTLVGETINFKGLVLSNTFTSAHNTVAFIKDFAPDYSSFTQTTVPLTSGLFSITMATDPTPGRHVQFGFQTVGVNVWATDLAPYGAIEVTVPEPTTLVSLALLGGLVLRRRR